MFSDSASTSKSLFLKEHRRWGYKHYIVQKTSHLSIECSDESLSYPARSPIALVGAKIFPHWGRDICEFIVALFVTPAWTLGQLVRGCSNGRLTLHLLWLRHQRSDDGGPQVLSPHTMRALHSSLWRAACTSAAAVRSTPHSLS